MLDKLLEDLKVSRQRAERARAEKTELVQKFQQTPEYTSLDLELKFADEAKDRLENELRQFALNQYLDDNNKHPHPKIEIKIFKFVDILNEGAAREWCFLNFRPALKLDTKAFEKAAKDGNIPPDLAALREEPRVLISSVLEI